MIFAVIILALAVVALSVFIIDIYIKLSELDALHESMSALQAVLQKNIDRVNRMAEEHARAHSEAALRLGSLEAWRSNELNRRNAKGQFTKKKPNSMPYSSEIESNEIRSKR